MLANLNKSLFNSKKIFNKCIFNNNIALQNIVLKNNYSNTSSSSSSNIKNPSEEIAGYRYKFKPGSKTGYGPQTHMSNRTKRNLFHGKGTMFGNNVSFSVKKTRRKFFPNVQNKRVFSFALNDFIRFKMTTKTIHEIDKACGIDNYLLGLDEELVKHSPYITRYRNNIASILYHRGELSDKTIKRLGYHKEAPPMINVEDVVVHSNDRKKQKYDQYLDENAIELDENEADMILQAMEEQLGPIEKK